MYRSARKEELESFPGGWKYGSYFTTLQTDPTRYLKWTADIMKDLGIIIEKRKISSFDQVRDDYDIIVNCTGIGAKVLCDDKLLFPLRGQVSIVSIIVLKISY